MATIRPVEMSMAEILDLSRCFIMQLHKKYAPTGVMIACMHRTASGQLVWEPAEPLPVEPAGVRLFIAKR